MREALMIDSYGISDRGKQRKTNEDQLLIASLNKGMLVQHTTLDIDDKTQLLGGFQGQLLLVADGMGGQLEGDRASALAVETVTQYVLNTMAWYFRLDARFEDDLKDELKDALERCQTVLNAESSARPHRQGMGTTLTMAYVLWPRLYIVHAGDSRCYLFRGGKLQQLTTDHNMAQQLVEKGVLAPEEAESSRWAHVLYKAIVADGSPSLSPEVYKATLENHDMLLLCTDGLTKHVADNSIAKTLSSSQTVDHVCRDLVKAANDDGGSDNTTVVMARFRLDQERRQ